MHRTFICFFHYLGPMFSIGFHLDVTSPNIEIHLPCGFFKVGWEKHGYPLAELRHIKSIGRFDGKWQVYRYYKEIE